jgi:hypothetical protein
MSKTLTDPISPWFIDCEELGEFIGIRYGRIATDATRPEWIYVRHTDFDGIGGFAELLRRRGALIQKLPQIKHPSKRSWWPLIIYYNKLLRPR